MSMKLLGEHFDIHGGGLDLVFQHHENEVVQSESYSGKPFATYWLHNGLLTKAGKKISKSDPGTVILMGDLFREHDPDTLRGLFLSSHYRRPIDYGPGRLGELARGLEAFWSLFERFERLTGESFFGLDAPTRLDVRGRSFDDRPVLAEFDEHRTRFLEAMDDDFNTGGALGELYELARALNRFADAQKLGPASDRNMVDTFRVGVVVLKELTQILGLFRHPRPTREEARDKLTAPLLDLLVQLRTRVRQEKNFALADEIRNKLAELGVSLEDRPDGTSWKVD
jgi:cysteinyl-tRNA synthetase